jgi:hypothetical protein
MRGKRKVSYFVAAVLSAQLVHTVAAQETNSEKLW